MVPTRMPLPWLLYVNPSSSFPIFVSLCLMVLGLRGCCGVGHLFWKPHKVISLIERELKSSALYLLLRISSSSLRHAAFQQPAVVPCMGRKPCAGHLVPSFTSLCRRAKCLGVMNFRPSPGGPLLFASSGLGHRAGEVFTSSVLQIQVHLVLLSGGGL